MDLNAFLENTADGVCAITPDGKIRVWNSAAEEILGYSSEEVTGKACSDIFKGRSPAGNTFCCGFCTVRVQAQQQEPIQHFEISSTTQAGKSLWLDVSILQFPATPENPAVIVHLFRDVTSAHEIDSIVRERLSQFDNGEAHAQTAQLPSAAVGLTPRELQVLRLMKEGASTAVIAEEHFISRATVRNHIQNIFGKLEVHNRLEAVAYANRHGL